MYFDSHVHSAASPDSEMDPRAAVAFLKDKGLGLTFTEHADFAMNDEQDFNTHDAPRGLMDFVCDFGIYPLTYEKLRDESVTLGMELGMTDAFFSLNKRIASEYDYDYILGAVHSVDGHDIYEMSKTAPDVSGVGRYLTRSRELVEKYDFIDAFAHIDYIARYTKAAADDFFYENYKEEFDALLKVIAERGIALEINTSRFGASPLFSDCTVVGIPPRSLLTHEQTIYTLCRRFKELGGRICTIGSDAHGVDKLAYCFDTAKQIAHEAELRVVYFKDRKPVNCE
ncbi:MAG: PHP domain-containing protein [Defluviitaleaceae bacterium]|nr:PHP domain-containing protein [Defluviitaleaceae bacterium]